MRDKVIRMAGRNDESKAVDEVEARLEELPQNFLLCRDIRHSWEIGENFHLYHDNREPKVTFVARSLRCTRCETERVTVYRQGRYRIERERVFYRYADGYEMHDLPKGVRPNQLIEDVQWRRAAKVLKAVREA